MSHSPCMLPATSRRPELVTDNTQPHSCSLAASQHGFSSADSVWLWHKTLPCQSKSPQCSVCFSQALFVCSQLRLSVCRSWWSPVECVKEGETGWPKGGAQFFPHTASTPYWYVTHLTIWGRQSKGHTEIELVTLKTHTHTHTNATSRTNKLL